AVLSPASKTPSALLLAAYDEIEEIQEVADASDADAAPSPVAEEPAEPSEVEEALEDGIKEGGPGQPLPAKRVGRPPPGKDMRVGIRASVRRSNSGTRSRAGPGPYPARASSPGAVKGYPGKR
ncbi:Camk1, partial [Symbiodinium sp. CCMP2456]